MDTSGGFTNMTAGNMRGQVRAFEDTVQ